MHPLSVQLVLNPSELAALGDCSSLFLAWFGLYENTYYLLILACGIFASLGPRNVYKDMLSNMVSLICHVVINHQNQTRTNGIRGHVRYTHISFWTMRASHMDTHKYTWYNF
jgi:hypothetical protein